LMSWAGEGWRLMEADWMAEASSAAGLEAMMADGQERWSIRYAKEV
jgi:hypothetical protein